MVDAVNFSSRDEKNFWPFFSKQNFWLISGSVLVFLILVGIGVTIYFASQRTIKAAEFRRHSFLIIQSLSQLHLSVRDAENVSRAYLVTQDPKYREMFPRVSAEVLERLNLIAELIKDAPSHSGNFNKLQLLVFQKIERMRPQMDIVDFRNFNLKERIFTARGLQISEEIAASIGAIEEAEFRLLQIKDKGMQETNQTTIKVIILGKLISIILFASIIHFLYYSNKKYAYQGEVLRRAHNNLATVNGELESFSYSVSHDLRAPLRAIDGYSLILSEDYGDCLDEEGKRLIAVVRSNAKKMANLIDDLLDFSRVGRKPLNITLVDMNELVESICLEVKRGIPEKNILFKKNDLPAAKADKSMLRQVWLNLVSNAVKFSMRREKIEIEVGFSLQEGEDVYWIKDNGVGFDMKYLDKLFGVFQRLHSEEEYEGTGVGLSLIKRIIERHGGRIWAKGLPNEGASFFFTLSNGKR